MAPLESVRAGLEDRRPLGDALIAATALHHGLTIVTRNVKDFEVPGLAVINPFDLDRTSSVVQRT